MTGLFLAMYGDKVTLGQAGFISIFAMIVVFLVLVIISYLIDIVAFFIKNGGKSKKGGAVAPKQVAPATPVKSGKVGTDTVAVIAAAIATILNTSVDNVKICSIRRVGQDTTNWSNNGLMNQTSKR